jgi:hypothetical protein
MNRNPGNGHEDLSMHWLRRQLKALSAVEPPASLGDRLTADIPAAADGQPGARCVPAWPRWVRWAGAAAAVIVVVSAVAWLGVPSGRQGRPIADMNSASARVYAADHNSPRPSDTNLCDINGVR